MMQKPDWWCGCGTCGVDRKGVLRDLLNCYSQDSSLKESYVDLDKFKQFYKTADVEAVTEVLCYLLDHLGYMEHSGSICCSQALTEDGLALRDWARNSGSEEDDE